MLYVSDLPNVFYNQSSTSTSTSFRASNLRAGSINSVLGTIQEEAPGKVPLCLKPPHLSTIQVISLDTYFLPLYLENSESACTEWNGVRLSNLGRVP